MAVGFENTAGRHNRITTATTTTPLTGTGVLDGVFIPAALTGAVTIYDNLTASAPVVVVLPIGYPAGPSPIGLLMQTGITVVTAAADEVVVIYRD